jgi:hypothetical protein
LSKSGHSIIGSKKGGSLYETDSPNRKEQNEAGSCILAGNEREGAGIKRHVLVRSAIGRLPRCILAWCLSALSPANVSAKKKGTEKEVKRDAPAPF